MSLQRRKKVILLCWLRSCLFHQIGNIYCHSFNKNKWLNSQQKGVVKYFKVTERAENWKVPIRYDSLGVYDNLYEMIFSGIVKTEITLKWNVLSNKEISLYMLQTAKSTKCEIKPNIDEDVETV